MNEAVTQVHRGGVTRPAVRFFLLRKWIVCVCKKNKRPQAASFVIQTHNKETIGAFGSSSPVNTLLQKDGTERNFCFFFFFFSNANHVSSDVFPRRRSNAPRRRSLSLCIAPLAFCARKGNVCVCFFFITLRLPEDASIH